MKSSLSKQRTKKTRSRERQASKAAAQNLPPLQRPVFGLLLGLLLWALTVLVLWGDVLAPGRWQAEPLLDMTGNALMLLIALCGVGLYIQTVRSDIYRRNAHLLMLAVIGLVTTVGSWAILYLIGRFAPSLAPAAPFLLPYALAPLLATILLGDTAGLAIGMWTSLVLATMLGGDFTVLVCGLVITATSSACARRVRTRSKVVKRGLMIGLTQTVFVLSGVAASWASADVTAVLNQAGACLLSGFASAIVALLILPLFEAAFKVPSDISLLELSDLGHPLLQRLAIEAPGTYHHSLVVANLATGAADAIGANSLLARVCAYYHDVGKLTKPDFFTENQNRHGNPHDDLAPSMSTLVITSHVKEGLSLGMRHRLPPPVMAVIHEHHGTSLLSCFHHKARRQLEFDLTEENGSARVSEIDFRYPGPRPSSRESAIICIADAVEAASRSLEKVTATHIEGLVKHIVQARVADGQLDDCPLSFDELSRVRRALVFSLSSMLHGRVPYPADESNGKQQTESGAAQPGGDSSADGSPDAEGRD